jgi:hypothetical protein
MWGVTEMIVAREIIHRLILRKRAAERALRRAPSASVAYHRGARDEAERAMDLARTIYQDSRSSLQAPMERLIASCTERNELVILPDGYVHYWSDGSPHGALSAWHLRAIADELDRRNRVWDARVRKALQSRSGDGDE